MMMMQL